LLCSQWGCQNCSSSGVFSSTAFWMAVVSAGTGHHVLQRQAEVGDDLLVEGDVAGVAHQELAEVGTRLGGGEQLGQFGVLEPFPRGQFGVLVDDERGHVPADLRLGPEQAEVDDRLLAGDVGLVVGCVARRPHLEHSVDAAVVEAHPGGVLVEGDHLDGRAVGLEHDLGDVGVDCRTRPRVGGEHDALATTAGRHGGVATGSGRGLDRRCRGLRSGSRGGCGLVVAAAGGQQASDRKAARQEFQTASSGGHSVSPCVVVVRWFTDGFDHDGWFPRPG
jgi:hypothetical protein